MRGVLANVILWGAVAISLCNYFLQFVVEGYESDPLITYSFMGLAGAVAGAKGLLSGVIERMSDPGRKGREKGPE